MNQKIYHIRYLQSFNLCLWDQAPIDSASPSGNDKPRIGKCGACGKVFCDGKPKGSYLRLAFAAACCCCSWTFHSASTAMRATMKAPMNTANLKRIPRLNDMAIPPEARIDGGPPCPSPGTRDRATLVIIRQTRARAAESRG